MTVATTRRDGDDDDDDEEEATAPLLIVLLPARRVWRESWGARKRRAAHAPAGCSLANMTMARWLARCLVVV